MMIKKLLMHKFIVMFPWHYLMPIKEFRMNNLVEVCPLLCHGMKETKNAWLLGLNHPS